MKTHEEKVQEEIELIRSLSKEKYSDAYEFTVDGKDYFVAANQNFNVLHKGRL